MCTTLALKYVRVIDCIVEFASYDKLICKVIYHTLLTQMCITSCIGNDLLLEAQGCTAGYLCLFVVDVDEIESYNFFL